MTVQQLIDGLQHYDPDIEVRYSVPAETGGRSDTHWSIEQFDVIYGSDELRVVLLLLKPR